MVSKGEDLELKSELAKLNKASLSAEEQAAWEEAQPKIDLAKTKFSED